ALGVLIAAVGVVLSGIAIIVASKTSREQVNLTRDIHQQQQLLTQRQLLLPLWGYLGTIKDVNPAKPVWPDVLVAANTLELIALCVEGGMVDPAVIRRTFA